MKKRSAAAIIGAGVLLCFLAAPLCADQARPAKWAQAIPGKSGLPNFFKVEDSLYRGAQPEASGFPELKALGVKTILTLRAFHDDSPACQQQGFACLQIKVKTWRPEESQIREFLKIAADPGRRPLFVHCQHGADRTGFMMAVYRVVAQGWLPEEALNEMQNGGFGFHSIWQNLIADFKTLDFEALKKP